MKLNIGKQCLSSFKTFTFTGKIRLGRPQEVIWSRLLHKARSGQNLCKPVRCVTPNPLLMFDKTFWKYFPFYSSPLPSPQLWCFASLFQVGFCPVAFPPVCKQRYPWKLMLEKEGNPHWVQEGSYCEQSFRLDTKGLPRYLSVSVSPTPLSVILISGESSWWQTKIAGGCPAFSAPSSHCSRNRHICLLMEKGDRYRVTAEPPRSTCGSNPAHLMLWLQNLLVLFASKTC